MDFRDFFSTKPIPPIAFARFGRYSDVEKERHNEPFWKKALEKFESGEFFSSINALLDFLSNNDEENIERDLKPGFLSFTIYQGSKRIVGRADHNRIIAKAALGRVNNADSPLFRYLLEKNYDLTYSRYGLNDSGVLYTLFDSKTAEASPYKLYNAFKEMATSVDKLDDLLVNQFPSLEPIDMFRVEPATASEKNVKYQYFRKWLGELVNQLSEGSAWLQSNPHAFGYLVFRVLYKIDYLIKPEGKLMEHLERMHRIQFSREFHQPANKNVRLLEELTFLEGISREDFEKEMYYTPFTFGVTRRVPSRQMGNFIETELDKVKWYQDNEKPSVALAIPEFVIGYCLFNYNLDSFLRQLFHLYWCITEEVFFCDLGLQSRFFNNEDGTLHKRNILRAFSSTVDTNTSNRKMSIPFSMMLRFENRTAFACSFLKMIQSLVNA